MSDPLERVTALIMGTVQGVFFRASALERAQSLNLVGWVSNLPDGAVELVAEGPRYALEQLIAWCHHGPPSANVEQVHHRYGRATGEFQTFSIRR